MHPTADITGEMNDPDLNIVIVPKWQDPVVLKRIDHPSGLIHARQCRQEMLQLRFEWPVVMGWQPIQKRPPHRTIHGQLAASAGTLIPQSSPELGRSTLGFIWSGAFKDPHSFS
jgi:hypothetical protein